MEIKIVKEGPLVLRIDQPSERITKIRPERPDAFREALKTLANDVSYRNAAIKNPKKIMDDFDLSLIELRALRDAAIMSGADVRVVDQMVAGEMVAHAAYPGAEVADIDISCCSCCCCCCGETAVAT